MLHSLLALAAALPHLWLKSGRTRFQSTRHCGRRSTSQLRSLIIYNWCHRWGSPPAIFPHMSTSGRPQSAWLFRNCDAAGTQMRLNRGYSVSTVRTSIHMRATNLSLRCQYSQLHGSHNPQNPMKSETIIYCVTALRWWMANGCAGPGATLSGRRD